MALRIFLSATLREFLPNYDPSQGFRLSVSGRPTVGDICDRLAIPRGKVRVVMVDGKARSMDHPLSGVERIGMFPPLGGG